MAIRQREKERPLKPRWRPIGIGFGNIAIVVVVHALTGSRAAAITLAVVLIASVSIYAMHLRSRKAADLAAPSQSVAPVHRAASPEPEDDFVVVRQQHNRGGSKSDARTDRCCPLVVS